MIWHQPSAWALLLLLLLPIVWWRWWRRSRRPAVRYSSVALMRDVPPSWVARLHWLPAILRSLVFIGLVICLARPQKVDEQTRQFSEGIAIQLVVDRSGSMLEDDFRIVDERTGEIRRGTRFDVVRDVVRRFILGGDGLDGRPNDLIGMIVFGTYADSLSPLTLDHDHVVDTLMATDVATRDDESQTAIGDALALAVERLRGVDERVELLGGQTISSKIVVLLTDGQNTAGEIDPLVGAELAAANDIRVYTIGAGSDQSRVVRRGFRRVRVQGIDEDTLRAIAERTGGQYFRARDAESLGDVYRQIDALEKTEIEQQRLRDTTDMATTSTRFAGVTIPALIPIIIGLLVVQILLETTRFGRLPT